MTVVKLRLDLSTPEGRAGMLGYLRALEEFEEDRRERERRGPDGLTVEKLRRAQELFRPLPDPSPSPFDEVLRRAFQAEPAPAEEGPVLVEPFVIEEPPLPGAQPDPDPTPPPPAEPPAPVDLVDVAPEGGASGEGLDPERYMDDALKSEIWALAEDGYGAADIAVRLTLGRKRIQNLLWRIRSGNHVEPEIGAGRALAVLAPSAGALAVAERRHPAQDPDMRADRLDEMTEAERRKFVTRSVYPEMRG